MTAIEELASSLAALGAQDLSEPVHTKLQWHVVDAIGAWLAASRTPEGAALVAFRRRIHAAGHGAEDVPMDVATGCALARLSEIDDIHLASMTTPGSIVIPGALTLARAWQTDPSDVTAAMIAGYEAMTRLGGTIGGAHVLYRGIWPTYVAAPFGVAAVAARLLRLEPGQTAHALALALTLAAPGVGHHNAATTSRWLALGQAARNGLAAALAARQGFTSDRNLVEGQFFPGVYGVTPDAAALTEGLGERVSLTEVSFKPWCAARQTMAATQALKEIIEAGVAPATMREITVSVLPPQLKMIDHGVVAGDRASHLTSVQYCMAVAALAPEQAFDLQQAPSQLPPDMRSFMAKIKVEADERLLADYPRSWPARVRVTAEGAAQHERMVTHVPGDPARAFDRARVHEKFLCFAAPGLGADEAERMLARCCAAVTAGQWAPLLDEIEQTCSGALARAAVR